MKITFDDTKIFFNEVYLGAREGASKGAFIGVSILATTAAQRSFMDALEWGNRSLGYKPVSPLFEGDCEMPQFENTPSCTQEPLFSSVTSASVYLIGTTTLVGMVSGGIIRGVRKFYPTFLRLDDEYYSRIFPKNKA